MNDFLGRLALGWKWLLFATLLFAAIDLLFYREFLRSLDIYAEISCGKSGCRDGFEVAQRFYWNSLNNFFDGFIPTKILIWTQREGLGRLPDWWKEGVIMLYVIVGQWGQIIKAGKAKVRDAQEYAAVCAVVGLGSYALGAAHSVNEAIFFGIAGTFGQLIARGSVSLVMGTTTDAEAWAGQYVLRSLGVLVWAIGLLFLASPVIWPLLGMLGALLRYDPGG